MSDAEPTLRDILDAVHEVSRTVHGHTAILETHDRRFERLEHRLDAHDKAFERVEHRLDSLSASVRDIWQLVGTMNRRNTERFDNLEMQVFKQREEFSTLKGHVTLSIGVLRDLIEARDFRLDDHGGRLNALETPRLPDP